MEILELGLEPTGEQCYMLVNGKQHTFFTEVEVVAVGVFLIMTGKTTAIIYDSTAEEFKRLWAEVEK